MDIYIELNGMEQVIHKGLTIDGLLDEQGLTGKRLAVEVNEVIVPKSRHADHVLQAGDRVEIVHAIGGG